jgi:hypothetical protein
VGQLTHYQNLVAQSLFISPIIHETHNGEESVSGEKADRDDEGASKVETIRLSKLKEPKYPRSGIRYEPTFTRFDQFRGQDWVVDRLG